MCCIHICCYLFHGDPSCRHGVTTTSFVPSQLHLLAREVLALHSPRQIAAGSAPCSSLKRILSGGEALTSAAAADITAALPCCQLWNTYGPTETTVGEGSAQE
jgi:non-ribosomal peptide synthetase component F